MPFRDTPCAHGVADTSHREVHDNVGRTQHNWKVKFTLNEVLGIVKCEFDEVIIDIIKRRRQAMDEIITSNAHETCAIKN